MLIGIRTDEDTAKRTDQKAHRERHEAQQETYDGILCREELG